MIVPMKKLSLLVMDKDREQALSRIRELGVLHLEKKTVSSPALAKLINRNSLIETAMGILNSFVPKKGVKVEAVEYTGDLAAHVIALFERRKTLQDYMFAHNREMSRFEKWGDFNPKDFAYLAGNGVNSYLYELPLDSYKNISGDTPFIKLADDKKNNAVRLLAFEKIPNYIPYPLPDRPLSAVLERNKIRRTEYNKIEVELTALSFRMKELHNEKKAVFADIEFESASAGMELISDETYNPDAAGKNQTSTNLSVSRISGYAPAPDMGAIKRAASENGWAIYADEPADDDEAVPTKLKNGSFTELIYPVTSFLELIPGYHERDISIWFLIFFTLFFAMIFGDAAYGAVLTVAAFIGIAKTAKKGVPLGFKFLLLMSVANVVWGALVCSWFGFDTARVPQFLQNISFPPITKISLETGWLASYNANNFWIRAGLVSGYTSIVNLGKTIDANMMLFCFSVALVQLNIAHIVNAIDCIKAKSLRVFGEIGKMGILLGIYFVILSLIVFNTGFGGVKLWQWCTVGIGFLLNFVFGSYQGNLLKSVLTSCANVITVILSVTNVFSDIMSYIRLWAVGLAAASIATIINRFADPMFSHAAIFAFGILFFAFGHGFNMVLNVLSILVHGVRLNNLEFSSHIGLNWSGFAYKPFAKR